MPKFKDLMHAILNEDIDEDDYEEEVVEQETIQPATVSADAVVEAVQPKKQPTFLQPKVTPVKEEPVVNFAPVQEKKTSIFDGMDVEDISSAPVSRPKRKEYHYDRSKMNNPKRRVAEDLEYTPVISPIFGNTDEEKKQFDKVHNAVNLNKPDEDFQFVQIISPMYGSNIPKAKPVDSIPAKVVDTKKKASNVELKDMLEKPKKESTQQQTLFED